MHVIIVIILGGGAGGGGGGAQVYDGVMKKVAAGTPLRQKIFHTALQVGVQGRAVLKWGMTSCYFCVWVLNIYFYFN